jgi:hypothetical protein
MEGLGYLYSSSFDLYQKEAGLHMTTPGKFQEAMEYLAEDRNSGLVV